MATQDTLSPISILTNAVTHLCRPNVTSSTSLTSQYVGPKPARAQSARLGPLVLHCFTYLYSTSINVKDASRFLLYLPVCGTIIKPKWPTYSPSAYYLH